MTNTFIKIAFQIFKISRCTPTYSCEDSTILTTLLSSPSFSPNIQLVRATAASKQFYKIVVRLTFKILM
jgi:hypothetical protein